MWDSLRSSSERGVLRTTLRMLKFQLQLVMKDFPVSGAVVMSKPPSFEDCCCLQDIKYERFP